MTLVDRPQIVFLDEPTTGLDPRSRAEMWQIVRELVAAGTTVLLTTQYLEEADELASRIAVLDQGHIVADGTPSELKRLVPGGRIRLEFSEAEELEAAATVFRDGKRDDQALALDVPSTGDLAALRAVLDRVDREQLTARALTVHTPDLEDVFFALTGRRGTEEPPRSWREHRRRSPNHDRPAVHPDRFRHHAATEPDPRRPLPVFLYMIGVPVVVLLLFVYVLGGTLGAGLPGGGDTSAYLTYVVPGIVFLAVGSGGQLAAISVSQDMTEGIIARFRTMDIPARRCWPAMCWAIRCSCSSPRS